MPGSIKKALVTKRGTRLAIENLPEDWNAAGRRTGWNKRSFMKRYGGGESKERKEAVFLWKDFKTAKI